MRLISLFSGIGAFETTLNMEGIEFELVNYCDNDKHASASFSAIHGVSEDLNLWDVTKIVPNELPDCDMITYGFPCQDISVAGKNAGLVEGTRSSLYKYALDIIRVKKPKYAIMENVKNLVGKKYRDTFDKILKDLEDMGYTNYWKVLNTKDYGIPQNRERVYVVSILGEHEPFEFPDPFYNFLRLRDLLEDEVDEKYYISDEKSRALLGSFDNSGRIGNVNPSGNGMNGEVYSCNGVAPTVTTNKGEVSKIAIPVMAPDIINKKQNGRRIKEDGEPMFALTGQDRHGVLTNECKCVGRIDVNGHDYLKRVYDPDGISPTVPTVAGGGHEPKIITNIYGEQFGTGYAGNVWDKESISPALMTMQGGGRQPHIFEGYRIRKLTPKECWRLQAFPDRYYEKARTRLMEQFYKGKDKANSQLYKQAGNSITVDVLRYIFGNLLK